MYKLLKGFSLSKKISIFDHFWKKMTHLISKTSKKSIFVGAYSIKLTQKVIYLKGRL